MIRTVSSLIVAVWFLQLAGGILNVITPIGLQEFGLSSFSIGLVISLHMAGFMIGAFFAPKFIGEYGNIRSFASAGALTGVTVLAQGLFLSDIGWALIRFAQGISFAAMFAAAEAWLGRATPKEQRGNVLGFYNLAAKAALFCGPVIIAGAAVLDPRNFLIAGLFLTMALVPICMTRRQEPLRIPIERLDLIYLIKQSPSAAIGVFIAGFVNTAVLALLPLYATLLSEPETQLKWAVLAYGAANIGGLISQWPAGRLSDHFDRRTVIAIMAILSGLAALSLFLFGQSLPVAASLVLLSLWGAGSLSFYGVCIAHGTDRAEDGDITALMSVLMLVWAFGSVLGPVIAGLIMLTGLGPSGLFAFAAIGLAVLGGVMLARKIHKEPVAEPDQAAWQPVLPAGLPGGDLDPRT